MSATPHNGKEADFQLFMALLDGDRFEGRFRDGVHYADTQDMMRRLTKEELLRFDGRPLFPERRAYTVKYDLSPKEAALYTAVTDYVRTEMNRVQRFTDTDGRKRNNVGFALQILQRRLVSSPAAIYRSLERRRERLENELSEARLAARGNPVHRAAGAPDDDRLRHIAGRDHREMFAERDREDMLEEFGQEEIDEIEDLISTAATSAETAGQLAIEVATLKGLEDMALDVLQAGEDTKWQQLNRILDDDLMTDRDGNRRKLVIFTEPKDTLHYLADKVRGRLGRPEAVAVIHGGVAREERRKVIARFMQDRDLIVLIANDAAGEGVNLQRGHLMVNYDLPWNPNRIEQRFGRIHRIGQTEVCHLWNIVAADTREGEVYARLLEKLEDAREALGGRVYDVLGELFEGTPLRDLLFEAIRYGEQDDVRARLFRQVDGAVDRQHLRNLLARRALTDDTMSEARVHELGLEMEQAEARRLQPHHVQSFFIEAFRHLGGRLKAREDGRWEITHVPARIRERDRQIGMGAPVQKKYERICFEKARIDRQPVATFVCPGHPLLEATTSILREQYGRLMRQGAVMVDDTDDGTAISVIVLIEHSVQDGRQASTPNAQTPNAQTLSPQTPGPHIVSSTLQFAAIDKSGTATNAGMAPHLDLRPATPADIALLGDRLQDDGFTADIEQSALDFATVELARRHLADVRARRLPAIEKAGREVEARLTKEINYWDSRAFELQEQEKAGKKTRLGWQNARRRAEDLAERLRLRQDRLEEEKCMTSRPPCLRGRMVVVPRGLLDECHRNQDLANQGLDESPAPPQFAEDGAARRRIELAAMEAVMATEKALGNEPTDVSARKIGYDIESLDPATRHWRFIEVKGRIDGANTVMITRQEVITSLNKPEQFILAIVSVENGFAGEPRYIRGALDEREPRFDQNAIQYDLKRLLERAAAPT